MKNKYAYNNQFKPRTTPVESISPLGPIYREAAPPKSTKRIKKAKKRGK